MKTKLKQILSCISLRCVQHQQPQNIQVTTPLYSPWLCLENTLRPSNFQQKDQFNEEWAHYRGSTCTGSVWDGVSCRDTWAEQEALRSSRVSPAREHCANSTAPVLPPAWALALILLCNTWGCFCLQLLLFPFQSPSWPLYTCSFRHFSQSQLG